MPKWTATNIQITKTERGLPGGNKAVDYSFTSTILRDGVEHHKYNETSVGGRDDVASIVQQIITSHLRVWEASDALVTVMDIPDVEFERTAPPDPTQEELKAQQIATEINKLRTLKERVELKLADPAEFDAQAEIVKSLEFGK